MILTKKQNAHGQTHQNLKWKYGGKGQQFAQVSHFHARKQLQNAIALGRA
jgi:hypothetical protein